MPKVLTQAITHPGFSVVEILSQCPTYFGRKNKQGGAVEMMQWMKENTVRIGKKKEDDSRIERGIFVQDERPEYCSQYAQVIDSACRMACN
jgi:2-oxoglutarate ferredoxin oxidoreductase subunit beta